MARRKDGGPAPPVTSAAGQRTLPAFAVFLLFTLISRPLPAQAPGAGPATSKVEWVKFSGSTRFGEDDLARTIGLARGSVVTRQDIQAAADRLLQLGWFNEVSYKFDSTSKGVQIQFTLHDAPCHPVWFDNFPWFTDA